MSKTRTLKTSILTAALLSIHFFADAAEIRNFTKTDYNAASQNWDISRSPCGIMYFANNSGILEFDSRTWRTRQLMNYSSVRSVFFDEKESRLYAAGTGEIGAIDFKDNGKYIRLLDGCSRNIGEIWDFARCGDRFCFRDNSNVYFMKDSSIVSLDLGGKIEQLAVIGERAYAATAAGDIFEIGDDIQSRKIAGHGQDGGRRIKGIFSLNPKGGGNCGEERNGSGFTGEGCGIGVVTEDGRLFVISPDRRTYEEYATDLSLEKGDVFCAAANENTLAVGTIKHGIFLVNLTDGSVMNLNKESGLQNNSVLSLYFDPDSNLWAGLDNGIDYIILNAPVERLNDRMSDIGCGYASAIFKGRLYLGTNRGLFVTDKPVSGENRRIDSFCNLTGQVWSLQTVDSELLCCHDFGLYVSDGNRILYHIPLPGVWKTIPLKNHKDLLLACTYERLVRLRKSRGRWEYDGPVEGFEMSSKEFMEDGDGRIWFAHWIYGLYRLSLSENADSVVRVEYFGQKDGFPTDRNNIPHKIGSDLVFSTEGGFFAYDEAERKAVYLKQLNSLFKSEPLVTGIVQLADGSRYYSSRTLQALEYTDGDGNIRLDSLSLKSFAGNRPIGFDNYCSLGKGCLLINTEDGFSIIAADRMRRTTSCSSLFIDRIVQSGSGKEMEFRNSGRASEQVSVPHGDNSMTISYIWPEYGDAANISYRCMLDGYDRIWSPFGSSTFKEYTRLPYGKYVFRVQAKNLVSGQTDEDEILIEILHPWYLSWPAYLIYLLLGCGLLYSVYRLLLRISERKAMAMARKDEEEMKQRHLKAELEHKAEDLAQSTMNNIRKNEILQQIDSDLQKAADYIVEDTNKTGLMIAKIQRDIRENITHDNDWQKFEKNFDLVYEDFLKRLGERFPGLTMTDKKMCAYLKMDLSSKDMAPLLNMTVRSVEMTRSRLRKKLGLERSESLTGFLQHF